MDLELTAVHAPPLSQYDDEVAGLYTLTLVYTGPAKHRLFYERPEILVSKAAKWPCMQRRTILLHDDAGHHVPYGFYVPFPKTPIAKRPFLNQCLQLYPFGIISSIFYLYVDIDPSIIHPKLYLQILGDAMTVINTCSSRTPFAREFHHSKCWFSIFNERLEWLVELCQLLQSNTMVFIPQAGR